jgi:glutamine synthetase
MILFCDVVEPSTGQPYERDPRSVAKKAEAYLGSTGIGDTAYLGAEPEFFVFDDVRYAVEMNNCFYEFSSDEGPYVTGRILPEGNAGHRLRSRAATSRCRRSTRARTCGPKWSRSCGTWA